MCIWQQKLVLINTLSIEYSSENNEFFALQRNSFFFLKINERKGYNSRRGRWYSLYILINIT